MSHESVVKVRGVGNHQELSSSANLGNWLARREVALRDDFVDQRPHRRRHVSADPIDSPAHEAPRKVTVVHGPGDDSAPIGVDALDELVVDQFPMLPEIASVGVVHGPKRIDRVARLEDADWNLRCDLANAPPHAMVEAVYGTLFSRFPNDRNDRCLDSLCLDLDEYHSVIGRLGQQLSQGRDGAVSDRYLTQGRKRGVCDYDSRAGFTVPRVRRCIVVYYDRAVGGPVDVELYRVGAGIKSAQK